MVVLVTGFEPNNHGINASEVLVKSLVENLPLTLTECRELLRFEVMPGNTNLLSAFIHLPLLPEQVIKERKFSDSPFMPIEMTRMALSLIIKIILKS